MPRDSPADRLVDRLDCVPKSVFPGREMPRPGCARPGRRNARVARGIGISRAVRWRTILRAGTPAPRRERRTGVPPESAIGFSPADLPDAAGTAVLLCGPHGTRRNANSRRRWSRPRRPRPPGRSLVALVRCGSFARSTKRYTWAGDDFLIKSENIFKKLSAASVYRSG
jgi:hypothetical protein